MEKSNIKCDVDTKVEKSNHKKKIILIILDSDPPKIVDGIHFAVSFDMKSISFSVYF